jgi:hypothetical protein
MNVKSIYPTLFQTETRNESNIPEKPTVIVTPDTFLIVHQWNPLEGHFIREGEDMKGLICVCEDTDHLLDCVNVVLNNEGVNLLNIFKFN